MVFSSEVCSTFTAMSSRTLLCSHVYAWVTEQELMMGPGSVESKVVLSSCVLEYRTEFISEHSAKHFSDHPERSVSSAVKSCC